MRHMIGKITGTLSEIDGNIGLIETASGLSYNVYLPSSLLAQQGVGKAISLYTYLQVREDAQVLFGFETKDAYKLYLLLLTVPGVGPKTAFSIISVSSVPELVEAIRKNNVSFLTAIPGLGQKTAMKILLELSQKLHSEFSLTALTVSEEDKSIIDALQSLGFKVAEAKQVLQKLPREATMEEKIRQAIRLLGKS